ncbi:hypothetical protein LINPERHAP1_LOCUS28527 [Linum perenne]
MESSSATHTHTAPSMATIDVSHPYFINSGDHPGLLIVSVPLIGDANYHSWSRSMKMPFSPKTNWNSLMGRLVSWLLQIPFMRLGVVRTSLFLGGSTRLFLRISHKASCGWIR